MGGVNGKPNQKLSEDILSFLANKTGVSHQEFKRQYHDFLQKHPKGNIPRKDFRRLMETYYGKTEKHVFRMFDFKDNGNIDFQEFMTVVHIMSNGTLEENLQQIFRIFDLNRDGILSQKDVSIIVNDLFSLLEKDEDEIALAINAFEEMDVQGESQNKNLLKLVSRMIPSLKC